MARHQAMNLASRAASVLPVLAELRVARPSQPLSGRWSELPVEAAGGTLLGISFRPLQAREFGLDPQRALAELLPYPFPLIRLAAYWNQVERVPGGFDLALLDEQIDAAEKAGKKIILCVGAVKAFGYPEFFVPAHHLPVPLPEGRLIDDSTHQPLLEAAVAFVTRIVEHYRTRPAIIAWQIEHDAVDPLGMEHSWRLAAGFVGAEVAAVRAADESRPIVLNGFLPTSLPVRLQQQWRTRDQGDSLAVAARLADIVGLDFYPRHGLVRLGPVTAYLAGSNARWVRSASIRYCRGVVSSGRQIMVVEGQGEPWETVTTPPSTPGRAMFSCLPEHVIENYNSAIRLGRNVPSGLSAYLFWGAEYWLLRKQQGDDSYLRAFGRVLAESQRAT